jgi:4-amino-4-deoxy-L-arabinose transferase-like glycosyltransferase
VELDEAPPRSTVAELWATYWPVLALAALVAVVTVVAREVLFPAFSWNRDEPVYLWHMEVLRSGRLTSTDGGAPLFFRPWLTGATDGVLFSQYTLGWPLVLAVAATVLGTPAAALPIGAALVVVGTYAFTRELTSDHTLALVSAAVMAACPIIVIQGGMYLGYLFTLGLGLAYAALLLSGIRRDRPLRVVAAGALLGWIFLTRPFDAVLWGLAVVGYVAYSRRADLRRLLGPALWLGLGLLPLVAATVAYNVHVTGTPLEFPITAVDPLDTFGFGQRRIMPLMGIVQYDLRGAVMGTAKNGFWFPLFLTGSYLGVLVALAGLWLRRRDRTTVALLAICVLFPLGYFPFWGNSLSSNFAKYTGPFYYIPLYPPLSILIATALIAAWRRRRRLGVALLAVVTLATAVTGFDRFDLVRRQSEAQEPWKEAAESVEGPSLVFLAEDQPYLMFLNPFASNSPELDDEVLFATDRGPANLDLIARMPRRTPVRQQTSLPLWELFPRPDPVTPEIVTTRLEVLRGAQVALDIRATNTTSSPAVVSTVLVGGRVVDRQTLSTSSRQGATHATRVVVGVPGATADGTSIPLPARRGRITVVVGFGEDATAAHADPVARERFPFRVHDDAVEVLLPAEQFREIWSTGRIDWQRTLEVPEVDVTASVDGPDGST